VTAATNAAKRGRGRPAVGRETALTLDDILDAAYAILRDRGLDALSMRQLAEDLGVTVKALYNHVTNKAAVLHGLVERVWAEIFGGMTTDPSDVIEWLVQLQLRTRSVWLRNLDLATLAMAVSEPDDNLIFASVVSAQVARSAGARDVGLMYNVLQTYTFGSIAVAANRRRASRYFGRDPDAMLAAAYELADSEGIPADARAVIQARFDEGDEKHFEKGLRLLVATLLAHDPDAS
jgi:TetR/AcrR family tetracycline transcriptional repressor